MVELGEIREGDNRLMLPAVVASCSEYSLVMVVLKGSNDG